MDVYMAAPYTKGDVIINLRTVVLAAEEVKQAGHHPYIPHLNMLWHMISPHEPSFWYEEDLVWLKKCHVLIRLPGESSGADGEVEVAKQNSIPVYFSVQEFLRRNKR